MASNIKDTGKRNDGYCFEKIYTSCDPDNTNEVPVSRLIDFIVPYVMGDLSALETLKSDLNPENKDICISSEVFYEIMNEWAKKIANSSGENDEEEFNRTPSQLDEIDEKNLPFIQSTPRASFGQKLLSCEGLLNLTNLSSHDLSDVIQVRDDNTEKQALEEKTKRLEYQLNKVFGEMQLIKLQLISTEEQNESLLADLARCRTRLSSEQQINEHLQKVNTNNEELREEINTSKIQLEELTKKLHQYEKDHNYLSSSIRNLELENVKLVERCDELNRREEKMKKDLLDMKAELDLKDHELSLISKLNDELKAKLEYETEVIAELTNANDLLDYKKNSLEKRLSSRRYSSPSPFQISLSKRSIASQGTTTIPLYSSTPPIDKLLVSYNSPAFLKKVLSPVTPGLDSPIYPCNKNLHRTVLDCNVSINSDISVECFNPKQFSTYLNNLENPTHSTPNILSNVVQDHSYDEDFLFESQLEGWKNSPQVSLHAELFQIGQFETNHKGGNQSNEELDYKEVINSQKIENESLKTKLDTLDKENEKLYLDFSELNTKYEESLKDLDEMKKAKQEIEQALKHTQSEKEVLARNIQELEMQRGEEFTIKTNKMVAELNENLLQLKKDYNNVQAQYVDKEKELAEYKNKFNFEAAYKSLQIELNHRNKELSGLKQSCNEYKEIIKRLSNNNQELEKSLKQATGEIAENEKLKKNLHSNTDTRNELVVLNKTYENKVNQLEQELQKKTSELVQVKDILKNDVGIKNIMWRDNNDLKTQIHNLTSKLDNTEKTNTEVKEDYKELTMKYNEEVNRNCYLFEQIDKQKEELSKLLSEYYEELDKNHKLCKKVTEYEEMLKKYDNKIKELEMLNDTLKQKLQNENETKKELDGKLKVQEEMLNCSNSKIRDMEILNDALKLKLHNEQLKSIKESVESSSESISLPLNLGKPVFEPKKRSFEKQKLTVDRLMKKIEELNLQLTKEKSKYDELKKILSDKEEEVKKLKEESEEVLNTSSMEKQSLKNVIHELTDKIKVQDEYYKRISSASNEKIKELSFKLSQLEQANSNVHAELNQKETLLKKHMEASESHKILMANMNKMLEEAQAQNQYLHVEMTNKNIIINNLINAELPKKDALIKQLTKQRENLQQLNEKSEKQLQELSLNIFEHECNINTEREEIAKLSERVQERDSNIQALKSTINDLESRLSEVTGELSEKNNANVSLLKANKILQERLSKTDDRKEKELMDIEGKIKNYRVELADLETEVRLKKRLMIEARRDYESFSMSLTEHINVIGNCSRELYRGLAVVIKSWHSELQKDPKYKNLPPVEESMPSEIEDQLFCLSERVTVATVLLEILSTKGPSPMEGSEVFSFTSQSLQISPKGDKKHIKRFTLRPARLLIGRPVSPDSPCMELGAVSQEIHGDISDRIKTCNSPDSQIIVEDSEEEKELGLETNSNLQLFSPIDLPFDDAFPHLTNSFLEKIGLHEDSTNQKLTKDETEKIFTAFAIQIALDARDIKDRLERQKSKSQHQHRKCFYLIKDISVRLRDHKCIGATDSINPIFVLLEDVRFLLKEIIQSAGELGILSCENRMMRCWNLVVNYMAILKKDSTLGAVSSNRRPSQEDKEINTLNFEEDLDVNEETLHPEDRVTDKTGGASVVENAVMGGYRCNKCIHYAKRGLVWFIFLIFIVFIGLLSIHLQCRMTTGYQVCPLDEFIRKVKKGTPPY